MFVQRLGWCSSSHFTEVVAVASALPGPTSTQVSFALGLVRGHGSLVCGLVSGFLFQYPGLLLMSVAGYLYASYAPVGPTRGEHVMHAVNVGGAAAGVALVFLAVRSLAKKVCRGKRQATIAVAVAVAGMMVQQRTGVTSFLYPGLIILSGVTELTCQRAVTMMNAKRRREGDLDDDEDPMRAPLVNPADAEGSDGGDDEDDDAGDTLHGLGVAVGVFIFIAWAALLAFALVSVEFIEYTRAPWVHWWSTFFKAGSLTFGGGHVVLPLLMDEITQKYSPLVTNCTVPHESTVPIALLPASSGAGAPGGTSFSAGAQTTSCGWVTTEQFLFGLALVQALPGPLFNLSAFLGAVMAIRSQINVLAGVAAAWLGLFTPGVLLIFSASSFWKGARNLTVYKDMLPGMNAAAVGLIMISCFTLFVQVLSLSATPGLAASIGLIAASSIEVYNAPAPLVILTGAALSVVASACGVAV